MGGDLRTTAGALACVEHHLKGLRGLWDDLEDGEELNAMAVLMVTLNPGTGETVPMGALVPIFHEMTFDERGKDLFARTIRVAAAEFGAVGCIFSAESYSADYESLEYKIWREKHPNASLSTFTHSKEVVMVTLEHKRAGYVLWFADIERVSGVRTLGPFVRMPNAETTSGRFTGVLPEKWMS